jgi:S-DNA-T family DNA segregation ATPase FtsK/SpoIIIE
MRITLLREIIVVAILMATGFGLLALATYHPGDPAWSVAADDPVRNYAGPVGAYVADVLLSFLGLGAYLLVAGIAVQGFRHLFGGWPRLRAVGRWLGLAAALVAASGLLHLGWTPPPEPLGETGAGGILGYLVGGGLIPFLNFPGTVLVLTGFLLMGLTAATGRPWLELLEWVGRAVTEGAVGAGKAVGRMLGSLAASFRSLFRIRFRLPRPPRKPARTPEPEPEGPAAIPDPVPEPAPSPAPRPRPEPESEPVVEAEPEPEPRPEPVLPREEVPLPDAGDSPFPPLELLDANGQRASGEEEHGLEEQARLLEQRLADFNITAHVVDYHSGPVVTRFELELAPGTKVSKVTNLAKDLARSLSVRSVRVVENVPGKPVIGLEVPRAQREMVRIREVLESPAFYEADSPLTLALGADIAGAPVVTDLGAMPHLLVAGTTGAGKSVGINGMLLSLVYKASPEEVRLILVDPKMLELSVYDGIPHLLAPVVTDMSEAANAFKWCIAEMERRFSLMAHVGVRSLSAFNQRIRDAREAGDPLRGPSTDGIHEGPELEPQPWIVVVVDELADLMMVAGKQVEESITRLAQKARAAGIHLVLATQRPSVDVLTGLIKANIPARIAFQVNQRVDSRTILDQGGAEQLLGKGDMLFFPASYGAPRRVHGAFVDDHEVERVVSHLKAMGAPEYDESVLNDPEEGGSSGEGAGGEDAESDPLYDQAVRIVTESRRASISNVQRRLRVGYNRAARLIDAMEATGVVGPQQSNGSREVLAPPPAETG